MNTNKVKLLAVKLLAPYLAHRKHSVNVTAVYEHVKEAQGPRAVAQE